MYTWYDCTNYSRSIQPNSVRVLDSNTSLCAFWTNTQTRARAEHIQQHCSNMAWLLLEWFVHALYTESIQRWRYQYKEMRMAALEYTHTQYVCGYMYNRLSSTGNTLVRRKHSFWYCALLKQHTGDYKEKLIVKKTTTWNYIHKRNFNQSGLTNFIGFKIIPICSKKNSSVIN